MATRLYMRSSTSADASPAYNGTWTFTTAAARRELATTADAGDTLTTTSIGNADGWTTQVCLFRQLVSPRLFGGQSISGTISLVQAAWEANAADNLFTRMGVFVWSGSGSTLRSTLLAVADYRGTEMSTTVASKIWANAEAISSYTTQAGDRIVIELGYAPVTGDSTPNGRMRHGSASVASPADYTLVDDDATTRNGWVEFSADLEFMDGQAGVPDVAERGPDTLFFGYSATAGSALATDLSGNANNWTHDTTWIYESEAASGLTSSFAVEWAGLMDDTDSGHIYANAHNGAPVTSIVADGAEVLDFYIDAAVVGSVTVPGLTTSSRLVFVQWSMEPNPLTTGASDTRRHDVRVYNADTGEWDGTSFLTETPATSPGTFTVFGAADDAGTDAFTGTTRMARLSSHHHTPDEMVACFLEVMAEPTLEGVERLEWPVPDTGSGFAADGNFSGPHHAMATKHTHTQDFRLFSPIINEICSGSWAEDSTWTIADPDAPSADMHLEFMRRRPIPPGANRVLVRLHVQQNDAAPDRVTYYAYCANAPGPHSKPAPSPPEYVVYSDSLQRNADDGTGDTGGAWITLGPLRIAQDDDGCAYFWIGFSSACPDYRVNAWSVEPLMVADTDTIGGGIGTLGS